MPDVSSLIIHSNDKFLVVNKPGGMLSQKSRDAKELDLSSLLSDHFGKPLHILTRLDRPVSGLTLFASDTHFNKHFLNLQLNKKVEKKYLALVEGILDIDRSESHYGFHDKRAARCRIKNQASAGDKKMTAHFKTLLQLDRYTLIQVTIHSGRFHQIRAQLSHLGHPVKCDLKYGAKRRSGESFIFLHALHLSMKDENEDTLNYTAALPKNIHLWDLVADTLKLPIHGGI
jgi:23S rRNA pseudouridine1911/1915/1917 synthase